MTFGEAGKNGVRTSDLKDCQEILDIFFDHGHKEIDTARVYAEGTTETVSIGYNPAHYAILGEQLMAGAQYLAKLDLKGATVDTK